MKNAIVMPPFPKQAPHGKDIPGSVTLRRDAAQKLDTIITAHTAAADAFQGQVHNHAEWKMLHLLLVQDAHGKAVVTKHIIEASGRSAGTVRNMLRRFETKGFVVCEDRIGRSELYRPTDGLRAAVNTWTETLGKCAKLAADR